MSGSKHPLFSLHLPSITHSLPRLPLSSLLCLFPSSSLFETSIAHSCLCRLLHRRFSPPSLSFLLIECTMPSLPCAGANVAMSNERKCIQLQPLFSAPSNSKPSIASSCRAVASAGTCTLELTITLKNFLDCKTARRVAN